MIASLHGKIINVDGQNIILEVAGVGYELTVSNITLATALNTKEKVDVFFYTHLLVREDRHALYGFSNLRERDIFRKLIKISGVGPKVAIAILSTFNIAELIQCIADKNAKLLATVPGIGLKTAKKLILELQTVLEMDNLQLENINVSNETGRDNKRIDAIEALASLGYSAKQAQEMVTKIPVGVTEVADIIKLALKNLTTETTS